MWETPVCWELGWSQVGQDPPSTHTLTLFLQYRD